MPRAGLLSVVHSSPKALYLARSAPLPLAGHFVGPCRLYIFRGRPYGMNGAELHALGTKLRTQVRGQFFEYIEGTLPLIGKTLPSAKGCPVCAERRKVKAEAMKRYRRKAKS